MQFGCNLEKIERQIEQLELQLEVWKLAQPEQQQTETKLPPAAAAAFATATRKPVRLSFMIRPWLVNEVKRRASGRSAKTVTKRVG